MPASGFTLVEVMVALGMTALVLIVGLKAAAALADNAQRQTQVMLAHLCAENTLTALKLARQLPGAGRSSQHCTQGGQGFEVVRDIHPTPNPNFQRVQASVYLSGVKVVEVSSLIGRF